MPTTHYIYKYDLPSITPKLQSIDLNPTVAISGTTGEVRLTFPDAISVSDKANLDTFMFDQGYVYVRTETPAPPDVVVNTGVMQKTTNPDGTIVEVAAEIPRSPAQFSELAQSGRVSRTGGDLSVVSTTFAALGAGFSRDFKLTASAKLWLMLHAYGRAPATDTLRLSIFVDAVNLAGGGGLSMLEDGQAGSLSISALTDVLAPGVHTIEVRGRVTGGTGTVFANGASTPLLLSGMVLEGDAPSL